MCVCVCARAGRAGVHWRHFFLLRPRQFLAAVVPKVDDSKTCKNVAGTSERPERARARWEDKSAALLYPAAGSLASRQSLAVERQRALSCADARCGHRAGAGFPRGNAKEEEFPLPQPV